MRLLVLLLIAGAVLAQAPSTPAAPGENLKSIGTMSEVMLDIIFPTSNEVFYVGRTENKSLEDWEHLEYNSLMLAESANLLMAENRAKDQDVWMKDAKLLRDVGQKAFKAAKAKDLEAMKALNDELYEACQAATYTIARATEDISRCDTPIEVCWVRWVLMKPATRPI